MSTQIVDCGSDVVILHDNGIPKGVRINGAEVPGTINAHVINEPGRLIRVRIEVLVSSVTWEPQT